LKFLSCSSKKKKKPKNEKILVLAEGKRKIPRNNLKSLKKRMKFG